MHTKFALLSLKSTNPNWPSLKLELNLWIPQTYLSNRKSMFNMPSTPIYILGSLHSTYSHRTDFTIKGVLDYRDNKFLIVRLSISPILLYYMGTPYIGYYYLNYKSFKIWLRDEWWWISKMKPPTFACQTYHGFCNVIISCT